MNINNIDNCEYSFRCGSYGGRSGRKDGIVWNGECWLVKYPKITTGMDRIEDLSYTLSPLSEYLGSHIYQILGIDTHETELVYRHGMIAVACKDFRADDEILLEYTSIRNVASREFADELDRKLDGKEPDLLVRLEELLLHLENNPILSGIPGMRKRFWEVVIVDALINNNDRNNGNWGVLRSKRGDRLAPVYDNGGSFSNKASDSKLKRWIETDNIKSSALNTATAFEYQGKPLTARKLFDLIPEKESDFREALIRLVPLIGEKMPEINRLIQEVPGEYQGIPVCSDERKIFYQKGMEYRYEEIMLPAYKKVLECMNE